MTSFRNEPVLELRRAPERDRLTQALHAVDAREPVRVPVRIGGDERHGDALRSVDPGDTDRVVAVAAVATDAEVDEAVRAATRAARTGWGTWSATERAATLQRAAGVLRARRPELTALQVRECAKPWAEADADVCEAIDFLEYYARGAELLAAGAPLEQLPGERNHMSYRPRGVVAVVAPWNFPLAIATGMTAAALATGNGAVLKPAEQSPASALALADALREAGLPDDAFSLLPGEGATGAALVAHPGVHTVAFTGSGAVGLEILRTAADVAPGQRHLKRVVAEMGGKNVVIVDDDADLDEVVPGLLASAYAFAGQKCSAASRVLVCERLAAGLEERLRGALATLRTAQAAEFSCDVPPVIERATVDRVERALERAAAAGARVDRGPAADDPTGRGLFVAPALVSGAAPDADVMTSELFAPALALEAVASVEEASDRIDEGPYALTGGLFTRNPRTIERVTARTPVGNLYVNRGTTGAMVGRQPFGGNRLSGTGTKAGGPDYLLSFVEPVVVTENTVRHGLVV